MKKLSDIKVCVGVTSCATGIAHTYMAADAIKKACKKHGIKVKVETQGAIGVENALKPNEIDMADLIVFANDVQVKNAERFAGKEDIIFSCRPGDVIAKPELIFSKCEQ